MTQGTSPFASLKPTQIHLDFVADSAGNNWRSLLTHLGIDLADIESFKDGRETKDACFKGLVYWLKENVPSSEPVTFGTLFEALKEAKMTGFISKLEKKFKAKSPLKRADQDLSTQTNSAANSENAEEVSKQPPQVKPAVEEGIEALKAKRASEQVKASSEVQDAVKLKQVQKELKELKLEQMKAIKQMQNKLEELKLEKESDLMKAKEQMKASSEAIKQMQKELELKLEKESDHMKAKEQGFTEVCCTSCNTPIAEKTHIIRGMHKDVDGPIYEYTNPAKYKHKTLTVSRAKNFLPQGQAYTEHSWFKGFTWTIITCKTCNCHLGWQFNACNKILDRSRFFGLTMASVEFV